jgi:hypothetical protein
MSVSHKSLLFLLGLVIGLLAGAGFFIFKMDELLKKVNLLHLSKKDTVIIQQQIISHPEEKKGKTEVKKYIGQKDTAPDLRHGTGQNTMYSADLFAKKYSQETPIKKVMAEADSLLNESVIAPKDTSNNSDENFIIKRDEVLDAKIIPVADLQQSESVNSSDSLLEKISGIKDEKKNISVSFQVEFWQSPVNYKGYKMTKNKIVLFGIYPEENIKLYHLDNAIFMKHNQNYYKLYFTDEFKQFEKVNEPSILSKFNK